MAKTIRRNKPMGLFGDNKENDTRAELAVAREEKAELEHVSLSEEETQMLAYLHVHNTPMPQIKRALLLGESQIDALLESEPVLAAIQIFEQEIQKFQNRIIGDNRARRVAFLKTPNERRAVHGRGQ